MFESRLKVLLVLLALATIVLVGRAFFIQVVHGSHWTAESARVMADEALLPTVRGRILDFKGREIALDEPCIDVVVDYRAITPDPDARWARSKARERLVRRDEKFAELPRAKRKELIDAEYEQVKRDIDAMWHDLARYSNQPADQIDELRRQIVRRVETRRRIVWYNKFEQAKKSQSQGSDTWYGWLVGDGGSKVDLDRFEITVAEQLQPHVIIPNVDYALRVQLERDKERYPGLELRPGLVRRYPWGAVACHVIGGLRGVEPKELVDRETAEQQSREERLNNYAASDQIGGRGLEALLEPQLKGRRGLEIRNSAGELIEQIPAEPGGDVRSTIDIVLTQQIESAFETVTFSPHAHASEAITMPGAAVVIDIPSGEVRALVSYPTYDLNKFDDLYNQLATDYINRPLANRATMMALEPGSTVKPLIGLGAITDGIIAPNETIECTGYLVIGGVRYSYGRCWTMSQFHLGHHAVPSSAAHPTGWLNFAEALERSCNIFHEVLGDKLGLGGESLWFSKFGLGRPTGIGLPEASGMLPDSFEGPAARRRATSWFAAIGQGQISATPIQMANVAATIARDGQWVRPRLKPSPIEERVDLNLNREAVRLAKRGMTNVVNGAAGTGTGARMSQFLVAAKTGSAQSAPLRLPRRDAAGNPVKDAKGRVIWDTIALGTSAKPNPIAPWYRAIGDDENKVASHAWMIGFAPAENPKIAFAVLVEYGGGGGTAAGSVVKKLLEACIEQGYLPNRP